jgi:stage III sporulation protein AH
LKSRKNWKRNAVIATVLLFVCAAAYLNWSYNEKWDSTDSAMAEAEDAAQAQADEEYAALGDSDGEVGEAESTDVSDYFAAARLTRQQSRDEALSRLESAASAESASQEVIDSAMEAIAAMASWSMLESQIENELLAKDFADCVVYLSEVGATVAVPAPEEGLSEAAVARVSDTVTSVAGIDLTQLKIIEVKH